MKAGIILLTILTFSVVSISQAKESVVVEQQLASPTTPYTSITEQLAAPTSEIDYKSMYEVQKGYSSDILSTVYWALSSILGVILLFVGSNLYLNFRFNKKQYEEFVSNFDEKVVRLESKLTKELEVESEKNLDKLTSEFNDRLDSFSNNLNEQVKTLSDKLGVFNDISQERIESLDGKLTNQIESLEDKFENRLLTTEKTMRSNVYQIEFDILSLEAQTWEHKEVYTNVFRAHLRRLDFIEKLGKGYSWWYGHVLCDIKDTLVKPMTLYDDEKEEFDRIIKKVPTDYLIEKSEVMDAINTMKIVTR